MVSDRVRRVYRQAKRGIQRRLSGGKFTCSLNLLLAEFRHLNFGCEQIRAHHESSFKFVPDSFKICRADLYGLIGYYYSRLSQQHSVIRLEHCEPNLLSDQFGLFISPLLPKPGHINSGTGLLLIKEWNAN